MMNEFTNQVGLFLIFSPHHYFLLFHVGVCGPPTTTAVRAQCVFTPTTDYGKALNIRGHLSFYAATLGDVRGHHHPSPFLVAATHHRLQVRVGAQITGNLGTAEYAISINDVRFVCMRARVRAVVRVRVRR